MLFSVFYVSLKKTILLYLKIYCILLGSSRVLAPPQTGFFRCASSAVSFYLGAARQGE